MKISGYSYAAVHTLIHILIASLLYFAVQPDLSTDYTKIIVIVLGSLVMDLDHIFLWIDKGVKGYLDLRSIEEFGKPRKYKMHNLIVLFVLFGGSILIIIQEYFFIGLFSSAAALHLLWDLSEDVLIFKMGYRHWI